jgi:mRNA-degrading endonuclease RelE of RelBE toxin-antitoxin system
MEYEIVVTRAADHDLAALSAYDRTMILGAIDSNLTHQPKQESRSKIKKLIQPAISEFRLRVGDFRVYYDVIEDDRRVVVLHVYDKGRKTTPEKGEL